MSEFSYSDDALRKVFDEVKTIALVGASPRGETRASWRVMRYLQNEGYKVYPVNPDAVGQEIHGEKSLCVGQRPAREGRYGRYLPPALEGPAGRG